jgi:hypothetical protein
MRYRYVPDETGKPKAVPVRGGLLRTDWPNKPYAQQIIRGYYDLECAGTFRPTTWSKDGIKDIWKEKLANG